MECISGICEALGSIPEQQQEQIAFSLPVFYGALYDVANSPLWHSPLISLELTQPFPADSLPLEVPFPASTYIIGPLSSEIFAMFPLCVACPEASELPCVQSGHSSLV